MSGPQGNPSEDSLSPEAIAETNAEAPAYPWGDVTNGGVMGGLTKRELFAAMAMQGLLSGANHFSAVDSVATQAALQADALLKELAK